MTPGRANRPQPAAIRASARSRGADRPGRAARRMRVVAASVALLLASWMLPLQIGAGPDGVGAHARTEGFMTTTDAAGPGTLARHSAARRSAAGGRVVHAGDRPVAHRRSPDAPGAPTDDAHDHEAQCFRCLALIGPVVAGTTAVGMAASVAEAAPSASEHAWRRPAIHEAGPRAPPMPTLRPA